MSRFAAGRTAEWRLRYRIEARLEFSGARGCHMENRQSPHRLVEVRSGIFSFAFPRRFHEEVLWTSCAANLLHAPSACPITHVAADDGQPSFSARWIALDDGLFRPSTSAGVDSTGANPPPGVRKFVVCPWYIRAAYSSAAPRYA